MLEAALHYEAVTFESVYLENTGNGGLSLKPLPIEAQFSTINASIITDVDGDLKDDILIAGNMYPVEVETTRNDASIGLMLKRSSKALEAIHVSKSGFNVSGQVKAMHTVKTERGLAILVVKNDDVVQVLKVNESIE